MNLHIMQDCSVYNSDIDFLYWSDEKNTQELFWMSRGKGLFHGFPGCLKMSVSSAVMARGHDGSFEPIGYEWGEMAMGPL